MKYMKLFNMVGLVILLSFILVLKPANISIADLSITGCATGETGVVKEFNTENYDFLNCEVTDEGHVKLLTGQQAIDPNNIIIPFTQDVYVTFLIEGAGYRNRFGWFLAEDAEETQGHRMVPPEDSPKRHWIFREIKDDVGNAEYPYPTDGHPANEGYSEGCCWGGDGVLEVIYDENGNRHTWPYTEQDLVNWGYSPIMDGKIMPNDMRKHLGKFAAGTEIVFFITNRYDGVNKSDWDMSDGIFYTKDNWNVRKGSSSWEWEYTSDTCSSYNYYKRIMFNLTAPESGGIPCGTGLCSGMGSCCCGWLPGSARDRLAAGVYGEVIEYSDDDYVDKLQKYTNPNSVGHSTYSHIIVGAPQGKPYLWLLGYEDLKGGGDRDYNDLVFIIERKTGGYAELKSSQAIGPTDPEAYITAATFEVTDKMPCDGQTYIKYYLGLYSQPDQSDLQWVEITQWDVIKTPDENGTVVTNWEYGTPEQTYRSRRVDFASLGISGKKMVWKAELVSEDETCQPEVIGATLGYEASKHAHFSRSAPVVLANVIYSGSYETPEMTWTDKVLRGHVRAYRIYDPRDPETTDVQELWDAGEKVSAMNPNNRNIKIPDITVYSATENPITKDGPNGGDPLIGDGTTKKFKGRLNHKKLVATTVHIFDGREDFWDKHTDVLEGSLGGTGTINRFTGRFTIKFKHPPADGAAIQAEYQYYETSKNLKDFIPANVTNEMLALNDEFIHGQGYTWDLDGDGDYDSDDGKHLVEWVRGWKDGRFKTTKKEWLLGAIDHSIPAVETPPPLNNWYYGTDITDEEREEFDTFRKDYWERQTVLYIGARDGMLHAFDAGKFRYGYYDVNDNFISGDNPATPTIIEKRGYFLWEDMSGGCPNYCSSLTPDICNQCPSYGTGNELWAVIPNNLIARLKNNFKGLEDQSFVDASVAVADVYIRSEGEMKWRTVILSAQGNGGDTVMCLDVTEPADPKFLWEFADPDLFRSRSSPAVGKIGKIYHHGDPKWVAFFVSGKTDTEASLYPSIYMINIQNGAVIQRIFFEIDGVDNQGAVLSGQPAIVDSDGNGYIDRLYIGDDHGYFYKVTLPDSPHTSGTISACLAFTTDEWIVNGVTRHQPIYGSPAVVVDNDYNADGTIDYKIKIFFGTGDSPYYDEDFNVGNTHFHFYGLVDTEQKDSCGSLTKVWDLELPAGHRVFTSAFATASRIYFGTSTSETENPCDPSQTDDWGHIYAINHEASQDGTPQIVLNEEVGNITTPPLVEDEHLYFKKPTGEIESRGGPKYNNEVKTGGFGSPKIKLWREKYQ
ncbi:MAG: DUF4114 domain-containing protein [Deltaproteobacteria bacterium]|nr:DUF4114 domain-containing protein [Deltaproteobacteria bacterium]